MTLHYPDVSQYTPNVDPAKYPILFARATLSNRVSDPTYAGFKAKAAAAGTLFLAYHWLNHGNLAAQAKWCFQHVGPDVPVMIDAEDVAGNTGYAGPLTVADLTGFAAEYRKLGGIVSLVYLPFWYWSGAMGAPHQLGELTAAGLGLVSSNYPNAGYTENGPGWAPYYPGAPAPVQWQYTSTPIDMNAFRGTVDDFAALAGGKTVALLDTPQSDWLEYSAWGDDAMRYGSDVMRGGPEIGKPHQAMLAIHDIQAKVTGLSTPTGPTQDQVDAAVAKVMNDPAWLAQLGAEFASHFHVS